MCDRAMEICFHLTQGELIEIAALVFGSRPSLSFLEAFQPGGKSMVLCGLMVERMPTVRPVRYSPDNEATEVATPIFER